MSFPAGHVPRKVVLAYWGGFETSGIIPLRTEQDGNSEALATAVERTFSFGLYREDLATFGEVDIYRQTDSEGFIRLSGLGQHEELLEVAR